MIFFIPGPSLAAEKHGPGLKFSRETENLKPRMNISSENGSFVRGGMFFSSENDFFRSPGPLGKSLKTVTSSNKEARLLKFHLSLAIIVFGDNELKCSKCYDRKAKTALRTSKCCNR